MERRGPYFDSDESILEFDSRLLVIEEIKRYANMHPSFDADFLGHVESCLARRGYVSSEHYNKLLNVYYSYYMDKKQCSLQKETKMLDSGKSSENSLDTSTRNKKPLENL